MTTEINQTAYDGVNVSQDPVIDFDAETPSGARDMRRQQRRLKRQTHYGMGHSQSQMVHEKPRRESRLKTLVLGTPEQREKIQEKFKNDNTKHFGRGIARLIFEPGYTLGAAIYSPTLGRGPDILNAVFVEACRAYLYAHYVIQPLATKLGEYLA